MKMNGICFLLSVGVSAVIASVSQVAHAASTTCNVSNVAWHPSGSGTVQVSCGGNWYFGFGSSGSCPVADADTKKAWFSLAQTALLTGKTVTIDFTTCTGGPGVTNITLNQ